jgi:hypothetical protein
VPAPAPAEPAPNDGGADVEPALPPPPPAPVPRASRRERVRARLRAAWTWTRNYFLDQDPTFWVAFTPALVASALVFVRSPASNYIFDEQEALLANPYVNGQGLKFLDAFHRDFWGLPPTHSIGSYRPIPDMIWRLLWHVNQSPWIQHWVNVVFHAANAALLAALVLAVTRRRNLSWLAGAAFLLSAVITEAVTGVVGIADVLGGFGTLLALSALRTRLAWMPLAVAAAIFCGLLSKESVLVAVPLIFWVALVTAPALHPRRPLRLLRALLALAAATGALVGYTYFRRHFFPVTSPDKLRASLPGSAHWASRPLTHFLHWFRQPVLPHDPINNPLINADFPHRVAGALRVYFRGLVQVVFPWRLSGDYSFAAEPIPKHVVFPESVLGGAALVLPPLIGFGLWLRALLLERRERKAAPSEAGVSTPAWSDALAYSMLCAVGLVWFPLAYFPHSNIPILLPTVRAERFWYLPVVGTSLCIAVWLCWLRKRARWRNGFVAVALGTFFFGFQAVRARMHALDYADDLSFWHATLEAEPMSAKAQLNYSVMVGARGHLETRLKFSKRALEIAPQWPMAHVYYADTLCRLHRPEAAWPEYKRGFEMAVNDTNLIALGLQCLWDEKDIDRHRQDLLDMTDAHPGSWLAYLARDIVENGQKYHGVQPKYRPRGYDQGPKKH